MFKIAKVKFYAVRVGKEPGIYETWAECQKQIHKFPNAEFKSFGTKEEAQQYVDGSNSNKVQDSKLSQENVINIYVDGSYYDGRYSWAFAAFKQNRLVASDKGVGEDAEAAKMRNVAGEIAACVKAIEWAEQNEIQPIVIHHDYSGLALWPNGSWKAKNEFTKEYAEFVFKRLDWVLFNKVEGHTGVEGNELVDRLAGEALGIK